MNIQERLAIFFQQLQGAPPAASAEEAMDLVCRLIEEVEDEFCALPHRIKPMVAGGLIATTRRHAIVCESAREITIRDRGTDSVIFFKKGKPK